MIQRRVEEITYSPQEFFLLPKHERKDEEKRRKTDEG